MVESARLMLAASGARVVDAEVAVGRAHDRFDEDGRLTDDEIRDELREAANALVLAAGPQLVAA